MVPALEVIDGQQRLTTLFILRHALNFRLKLGNEDNLAEKMQYSIRHADVSLDKLVVDCVNMAVVTPVSFEQLKASLKVIEEEHQDHYYLKCAVLRCVYELSGQKGKEFNDNEKVSKFREFVLTRTKLLVNVIEPHVEGEVIFGNLNSNKVLLTETELIKGLLLTRVARESVTKRPRQYREILEMRIYLGRKWDEICRWANQPEIRSLYFPDFKDGMTGLLHLVALQMKPSYKHSSKDGADTKPLFEYFLGQRKWEPVFSLLTNTHASLDDWYGCSDDYHLLGYVLLGNARINKTNPKRLPFLVELLCLDTKTKVTMRLMNERKQLLFGNEQEADSVTVKELAYDDDNGHIQNILLALSVFRIQKSAGRFDFYAYHDEEWTLEHIFPQTPFGKGAKLTSAQEKAVYEILINNSGKILSANTVSEISQLQTHSEDPDNKKRQIEEILKRVPILHRIGNLCLLSRKDNAAMGCRMFDNKREMIRDRIVRGSFVPLHTYEVFSKMIVGETTGLEVWSKADIDAHEDKIAERVQKLVQEAS